MIHEVHQAIVVVGEGHAQSKTVDGRLIDAIDNGGFRARQMLVPSGASPLVDTGRLPLAQLKNLELLDAVAWRRDLDSRFVHTIG
jgi:hypothetical protein